MKPLSALRYPLSVGLIVVAQAAAAQEPLTLARAIELAKAQSHHARAAVATREAARYRDRAFYTRLLPQISLGGTLPSYNRSIIQVLQPDGSTLFRPQDQTNATMTMTMSQKLPVTGGDFFITSSLARLAVSCGNSSGKDSSTPIS